MNKDIVQNLEVTGFCWKCGKVLKPQKEWVSKNGCRMDYVDYLSYWCNVKCQNQYERKQESCIMKGKRAGYGVKGSCR